MTRTYINGVSRLSFNNGLVSFVLNDTKTNENGDPQQQKVAELITDPETLIGICTFILDQLNSADEKKKPIVEADMPRKNSTTIKSKGSDIGLTVGRKIASSDAPHN